MNGWVIAALVVAWVLAGALTAALIVCIQQYGRALVRLDELHEQMHELAETAAGDRTPAARPPMDRGLPIGTEAPAFELPDLEGNPRRPSDYLGEPFVLAFFNPGCGYCLQLSPRLGRLGNERKVLVVTQGDLEQNRRLVNADDWNADVVIEDDWAVIKSYDTPATPSGYLIDEQGRIASPLVMGVEAVLALHELVPMTPETAPAGNGNGVAASLGSVHITAGGATFPMEAETAQAVETAPAGLKTRDVKDSKIVRDGLKRGTIAPTFVLPDLEGRMHALTELRGKRVLLVFSDVNCGPCKVLAPRLAEFAEHAPDDLQVVMISRGETEENRLHAVAQGYTFPVLLQRSWEASKLYGMFATPIGYLIDEDGVIAKGVAVGPDAILALAT